MIDSSASLAALVMQQPERTRVLERFGLDYCCGGSRTLAESCADRGVDVEVVVDALAAQDVLDGVKAAELSAESWPTLGLAALARHIIDVHHSLLRVELPRLDDLIDKVVAAHGSRHPELDDVADTFRALRSELELHMMKEERVLFPWCIGLASGSAERGASVDGPIHCMMQEHDAAGANLATLRRVTDDYAIPEDACASYRALFDGLRALEADLHEHILKENYALFPRAIAREQELLAR